MHTNYVITACQALANAGKKPTIALVKTKLAAKVPLAIIVRGIQQFSNSSAPAESPVNKMELEDKRPVTNAAQQNNCACVERLTVLEKEMSAMAAYIISLQEQVEALTER